MLRVEVVRACRVVDIVVEAHFETSEGGGPVEVGVKVVGSGLQLRNGGVLHVEDVRTVAIQR